MKQNKEKGITLIALVITIIVLLILAGVAIATLTGDNGVLTKAVSAKEKTERAEVIENAKLDILGIQSDKNGKITIGDLKGVLDKYFKDVPGEITAEDIATLELTTKDGKHKIKVSEIYNEKLEGTSGAMSVSDLKVGDYVKYGDKLTAQSYITKEDGEPDTGYETSQTFNTNTTTLWRVINKKANGDVEIVAVNNTLSDDGKGLYLGEYEGFINAKTVLDNLCLKLYANPTYGTARSINADDINNLTEFDSESVDNPIYTYTVSESMPLYDTLIEETKGYTGAFPGDSIPVFFWLASSCEDTHRDDIYDAYVRCVKEGKMDCELLYTEYSGIGNPNTASYAYSVRPIVTLNSNVQIDTSDATKDGSEQGKAWILK